MNNSNQLHQPDVARHQVIAAARALMPHRPLLDHEARSVAERQAQRLTELLDLHEPHIDLEAITALPRIEVRLKAGLPVSGFSEWNRGRWVVAINQDDHWTRKRFTLGHELKHILDNPFIDGLYLGWDGKPSAKRAEAICDYFAACLLMPRPKVKAAWVQGHQRVDDLAAHFGVSRAAMGLRLQQIGLTSPQPRCGRTRSSRYQRAGMRPSYAVGSAQTLEAWT